MPKTDLPISDELLICEEGPIRIAKIYESWVAWRRSIYPALERLRAEESGAVIDASSRRSVGRVTMSAGKKGNDRPHILQSKNLTLPAKRIFLKHYFTHTGRITRVIESFVRE
jgi:hypothetical protein